MHCGQPLLIFYVCLNQILVFFQTVIEGFDPDKFRQVNQHQPPLHQNVHSPVLSKKSSRVFRHQNATDNSETGFDHHQLIPGAVPTYDMSEKQLLAALEQELGVL